MIRKLVSGERLFRLALCSLSLIAATGRNVAQSAQRTDADVQHFVDSLLQKMTTEPLRAAVTTTALIYQTRSCKTSISHHFTLP